MRIRTNKENRAKPPAPQPINQNHSAVAIDNFKEILPLKSDYSLAVAVKMVLPEESDREEKKTPQTFQSNRRTV